MSRFDLIFVLTDKPEKRKDTAITEHILKAHQRGQVRMMPEGTHIDGVDPKRILENTDNIRPVYDVEILRKYVAYSKRMTPVMTEEAKSIIERSYLRIRTMGGDGSSVPITARQLEAFVRLSEASAKMRLSSVVTDVDANRAVDLVEDYLRRIAGSDDGGFDIDKIATGISSKDRNKMDVVREIMRDFGGDGLTEDEFVQHGESQGIPESEVRRALKQLHDAGEFYKAGNLYKRV